MQHNDILAPTPPMMAFLTTAGYAPDSYTLLAGDASARRYSRIHCEGRSYIVMHSPPSEKLPQFVKVCDFLRQYNLHAPQLFAVDAVQGYAILEDFGDKDYLSSFAKMQDKPATTHAYQQALQALVTMQKLNAESIVPPYSHDMLMDEMNLYPEWFCAKYQQKPLSDDENKHWQAATQWLVTQCLSQTQVFVHRDYHSRNLMHVGDASPALLDFQDAVVGPIMYDVVSLLRDAYILWSPSVQESLLRFYWQNALTAGLVLPQQWADLLRDYHIVSVQRGLKVAGIFARLHLRDKKDSYLQDMPRVFSHLQSACSALPELSMLQNMIAKRCVQEV